MIGPDRGIRTPTGPIGIPHPYLSTTLLVIMIDSEILLLKIDRTHSLLVGRLGEFHGAEAGL